MVGCFMSVQRWVLHAGYHTVSISQYFQQCLINPVFIGSCNACLHLKVTVCFKFPMHAQWVVVFDWAVGFIAGGVFLTLWWDYNEQSSSKLHELTKSCGIFWDHDGGTFPWAPESRSVSFLVFVPDGSAVSCLMKLAWSPVLWNISFVFLTFHHCQIRQSSLELYPVKSWKLPLMTTGHGSGQPVPITLFMLKIFFFLLVGISWFCLHVLSLILWHALLQWAWIHLLKSQLTGIGNLFLSPPLRFVFSTLNKPSSLSLPYRSCSPAP